MEADGSNARLVFTAATPLAEAWSPDGRSLAFVADPVGNLVTATLDIAGPDGRVRELGFVRPSGGPAGLAAPSWAPDGRRLAYATSFGVSIFGSDGAAAGAIADGSEPAWSPDGSTIAYRDSGPCADRSGIAVVAPDGSNWRKLTNDCRIFGTEGADQILGTGNDDEIIGKGGDDRLDGSSGYDTIYGGDGNDVIIGGPGIDTVFGGPGNDTIQGNVIFGGPGRDRISVPGDWPAVIYAVDGERDRISCGRAKRDVLYADRLDRVGPSCERVYRR